MSTRGAAVPARSHTRTVPSSPPLTAVCPSALTATAYTKPSWPVSTRGAAVPARSHTRTVPSVPLLTAVCPSALTATPKTLPPWPVSTRGAAVPARSHTRTVPSMPLLTAVRPSALTATAITQLSWPASTRGAAVPARSHTRTVPSQPPLTAVCPSALTATAYTKPSWPVSTRGAAVPARSHTRTVPSPAAADRGLPVRADRHRVDIAAVAGERPRRRGPGQVPHPHRGVVAAADRGLPVRADRHPEDIADVADEGLPERLARLRKGGPDRAQPGCMRPRPRGGMQPGQLRLAPSDRPPGELGRQLVRVNLQDVRGQPDRGLHQGQPGLVRDGGVVGEQPGHAPGAQAGPHPLHVGEQPAQLVPAAGRGQMPGQVLVEVAVIRPGRPAARAAGRVPSQQLVVRGRQRVAEVRAGQVKLQVMQFDPTGHRIAAQQRQVAEPRQQVPGIGGGQAGRSPQRLYGRPWHRAVPGEHGQLPVPQPVGGVQVVQAQLQHGQQGRVRIAGEPQLERSQLGPAQPVGQLGPPLRVTPGQRGYRRHAQRQVADQPQRLRCRRRQQLLGDSGPPGRQRPRLRVAELGNLHLGRAHRADQPGTPGRHQQRAALVQHAERVHVIGSPHIVDHHQARAAAQQLGQPIPALLHIRDLVRGLTRRGQLGCELLLPLRQHGPPRRRSTRRRLQPHPRQPIRKPAAHRGVPHQRSRQHRLAAACHPPHAHPPRPATSPVQQRGTQPPQQFRPHHMVRRQLRPRPPHAARPRRRLHPHHQCQPQQGRPQQADEPPRRPGMQHRHVHPGHVQRLPHDRSGQAQQPRQQQRHRGMPQPPPQPPDERAHDPSSALCRFYPGPNATRALGSAPGRAFHPARADIGATSAPATMRWLLFYLQYHDHRRNDRIMAGYPVQRGHPSANTLQAARGLCATRARYPVHLLRRSK